MPTILPIDDNNNPIPALRLREGGAHKIDAGAVSTRNITAFDAETRIVSLYATGAVYLRFGGAMVEAGSGDHYFPGNIYYDIAIGGDNARHYSHVAVTAAEGNAVLYVSEKI